MGGWSLFSFDLELFVQVRQAEEEGFLAEVQQFALFDLEDLWNFQNLNQHEVNFGSADF